MPDRLTAAVSVTPLPAAARFSLRVAGAERSRFEDALRESLPPGIGGVAGTPERFIACLGPDEWQLTVPLTDAAAAREAIRALPPDLPCSVTDIGARELCYLVQGPQAATLLNAGCPRNLPAMPVPSAARTVFDGTPVTLVKWNETVFRLEIWRSFAPHMLACLDLARRDIFELE